MTTLHIKLSYRNQTHEFDIADGATLSDLREHLQTITKVPPQLQKLMANGIPQNP
jgi:hypothetical protein